MSSKIKVLPEHLINQIAAGEVIERPASVVKELVENAIDARATDIAIELRDAGKSKIVVEDNGEGMTPEEAELSLERHATSKIKSIDDLFQVKTLGFRGEALPSIASISKLTVTTRTSSTPEGFTLAVHGGKVMHKKVAGAPRGTQLVVEDLFYNTPARLKFLKSTATELSRSAEHLMKLAMANPEISFRLTHQNRKVFQYPATGELKERVLAVLHEKEPSFLPVEEAHEGWGVRGYVGLPHLLNPTPRDTFTFIDGRPISDRTIMHAIASAYQGSIPQGMYPKVILFLTAPAGAVDVNAHPTKREVRFKQTHFVHQLVEQSIRRALQQQSKTVGILRASLESFKQTIRDRTLEYAADYLVRPTCHVEDGVHGGEIPRLSAPRDDGFGSASRGDGGGGVIPRPEAEESPRLNPAPLFGVPGSKKGAYASLTYIGQLKSSYLVCEDQEALVFIDQHAAHERVQYEKLKRHLKDKPIERQYLLTPLSVELTEAEAMVVQEQVKLLEAWGFEIEPFGGRTFVVKAVPLALAEFSAGRRQVSAETIRSILAELGDIPASDMSERLSDHLLSTLACHSARTAHEKLERQEVEALLKSLDQINASPHCPHGRPFSFAIPIREIEKKFHR